LDFSLEPPTQLTSIDVIASALDPVTPNLRGLSSPDGAITLMLSDIADAGAEAERLGPERWERVLLDHHALVDQLVSHHGGEVSRFERDGFVASFASAHGGLHAAVELQRTFTGAGSASLALRAGLHSGFVIGGSDQLLGRNVVLAARIAAAARPAEILVSSTIKQYTQTDPGFVFEPRGWHHFKGLLGEHDVYAVPWS
jgi:class 3 adenylate cyclase